MPGEPTPYAVARDYLAGLTPSEFDKLAAAAHDPARQAHATQDALNAIHDQLHDAMARTDANGRITR